jgi:hypothetical protein
MSFVGEVPMNKRQKKLGLTMETLRTLSMDELAIAAGGGSAEEEKMRHLQQMARARHRFVHLEVPPHWSRFIGG